MLLDISDIKIPRCFTANTGTPERIDIHGFGDASPKAYGAAVYVRTVDMNGHINTKLVMSKSRVAPLKKVTLPRLELLGSVINARLVSFVAESMKREMSQVVCGQIAQLLCIGSKDQAVNGNLSWLTE